MKDETLRNDHVLKLTGKAELPNSLEIGTNYEVKIKGSITSLTEADKFDGTHVIYYKFEPVLIEVINEIGKTLKLKDKRRVSQKIRNMAWKEFDSLPPTEMGEYHEFEDVYEELGYVIMSKMGSLIKEALHRMENK
jgi:hypothetical protein